MSKSLVALDQAPMEGLAPLGGWHKRTFDVTIALLALLSLAPLIAFLALLVKASDGGPALFKHYRVGYGGATFPCLKFRSMVQHAPAVLAAHLSSNPAAAREWSATQKLRYDPRITVVGRILRATSLDELPQLWNVVRGDMSLVGPRPIVANEATMYGRAIRYYLLARPGLTGLWQVSGRSETTYRRRVALDTHYARTWSIGRDLAIVFRTVPAVMKRQGSW